MLHVPALLSIDYDSKCNSLDMCPSSKMKSASSLFLTSTVLASNLVIASAFRLNCHAFFLNLPVTASGLTFDILPVKTKFPDIFVLALLNEHLPVSFAANEWLKYCLSTPVLIAFGSTEPSL